MLCDNALKNYELIDTRLNFSWIGISIGNTNLAAGYSKKGISDRIKRVNVDMIPINLENS